MTETERKLKDDAENNIVIASAGTNNVKTFKAFHKFNIKTGKNYRERNAKCAYYENLSSDVARQLFTSVRKLHISQVHGRKRQV